MEYIQFKIFPCSLYPYINIYLQLVLARSKLETSLSTEILKSQFLVAQLVVVQGYIDELVPYKVCYKIQKCYFHIELLGESLPEMDWSWTKPDCFQTMRKLKICRQRINCCNIIHQLSSQAKSTNIYHIKHGNIN